MIHNGLRNFPVTLNRMEWVLLNSFYISEICQVPINSGGSARDMPGLVLKACTQHELRLFFSKETHFFPFVFREKMCFYQKSSSH